MRWWLALLPLAACDVAPRPIDLERSFIETPDEGYQVFVDIYTAIGASEIIAGACDAVDVDREKTDAYADWSETEFFRLAEEDPETFDALARRVGLPLRASDVSDDDFTAWETFKRNFSFGTFAVVNLGFTVDAVSRATGVVIRNGAQPDCDDAAREREQGTLTGLFLRDRQTTPASDAGLSADSDLN